jgi:hypothetical protein
LPGTSKCAGGYPQLAFAKKCGQEQACDTHLFIEIRQVVDPLP